MNRHWKRLSARARRALRRGLGLARRCAGREGRKHV